MIVIVPGRFAVRRALVSWRVQGHGLHVRRTPGSVDEEQRMRRGTDPHALGGLNQIAILDTIRRTRNGLSAWGSSARPGSARRPCPTCPSSCSTTGSPGRPGSRGRLPSRRRRTSGDHRRVHRDPRASRRLPHVRDWSRVIAGGGGRRQPCQPIPDQPPQDSQTGLCSPDSEPACPTSSSWPTLIWAAQRLRRGGRVHQLHAWPDAAAALRGHGPRSSRTVSRAPSPTRPGTGGISPQPGPL